MYDILIFIILKKLESEIFESMPEVRITCLLTMYAWPYGTGGRSYNCRLIIVNFMSEKK